MRPTISSAIFTLAAATLCSAAPAVSTRQVAGRPTVTVRLVVGPDPDVDFEDMKVGVGATFDVQVVAVAAILIDETGLIACELSENNSSRIAAVLDDEDQLFDFGADGKLISRISCN